MKAYRLTEAGWVIDDRPLWCRVRRWLVNVGLRELKNGRLANEGEVTPLSFFGHMPPEIVKHVEKRAVA